MRKNERWRDTLITIRENLVDLVATLLAEKLRTTEAVEQTNPLPQTAEDESTEF